MATKSTVAKAAPSAKARFIAKPYGKHYRVYDTVIGSYPVDRPDLGMTLPTYADKAECEAVAAELDAKSRQ